MLPIECQEYQERMRELIPKHKDLIGTEFWDKFYDHAMWKHLFGHNRLTDIRGTIKYEFNYPNHRWMPAVWCEACCLTLLKLIKENCGSKVHVAIRQYSPQYVKGHLEYWKNMYQVEDWK